MKTYIFKISYYELFDNEPTVKNEMIQTETVGKAIKSLKEKYVGKRKLVIDFIFSE